MTENAGEFGRPRGDYGFDGDYRVIPAPVVAAVYILICLVPAEFAVLYSGRGEVASAVAAGLVAVLLVAFGVTAVRATRVGKFEAWGPVLQGLGLRGDEEVLDMGCGRGAVLLSVAKLLPGGRATGIDIWRADQTGNSPDATWRNAELEGVSERIEVCTGDMTHMPFDDGRFDVIVSSLAIHNVSTMAGRLAAVDEAVRVLRPGGRLAVADIGFTKRYAARLRESGMNGVSRRSLGWRFWWGGPWLATWLVTATKPESD
ncbi:class I SAM-dependent methyltransferase [Streptomyces nanshensis]|uniref:Methyltransferase n=1 Tax=Streptomyces nanshensis TaxID=518642 RepID=A0A1E7KXE0_9ACTN|nr:class I SAM-dependent methyltransferase [Streptomyces nanshensis]OEV08503.1 methyltransferase [Streptomyces nanshensis]